MFYRLATLSEDALQTFMHASRKKHFPTNPSCFFLSNNVLRRSQTLKHCLISKFQIFNNAESNNIKQCGIVGPGPYGLRGLACFRVSCAARPWPNDETLLVKHLRFALEVFDHCLASRVRSALFSEEFKAIFFLYQAKNVWWSEQCFLMGQTVTHCCRQAISMLANNVWLFMQDLSTFTCS